MIAFQDFFIGFCQLTWNFWFLLMLAPLQGALERRRSSGNRMYLVVRNMLVVWGALLVMRQVVVSARIPSQSVLPEGLFWLTGLILGIAFISMATRERRQARQQMAQAQVIDDLQEFSPAEFEQLVAETYRAFGYKVQVVAAQGDHGIDLRLESPQGERSLVQCKRWKGKVGEPVVRDFYGAMQHENAIEGAIVTSGTFTPQARAWAKDKPIRLYDGEAFLKVLEQARQKGELMPAPTDPQHTSDAWPTDAAKPPYCPQCGAPMVLRKARRGPNIGQQFYGCSTYPQCRTIIEIESQS